MSQTIARSGSESLMLRRSIVSSRRWQTRRSGDPVPTDGDRIICISPTEGQVSDRGYLERREDRLMICSKPYYHIYLGDHLDGQIYTTCSGGPWTGYMTSQEFLERAEYQGKTTAWFWTRGSGESGIHFEAEVHLWRYTSKKGF